MSITQTKTKFMHRTLYTAMLAIVCFASCEISVHTNTGSDSSIHVVKQSMQTGLKTTANGLSFEDHHLVNDKNEELVLTQFQAGNVVAVVVTGVDHFTEENNRVYPGISITVTDTANNIIMDTGNLFSQNTAGFTKEEAAILRATLTIGAPITVGDYTLHAKFWDTKGKGEILSELAFSVVGADEYD